MDLLNRHADSGEEIDLSSLLFAFTLDSFARLALGLEVGSLTSEGIVNVPFAQAFDYAQWVSATRIVKSVAMSRSESLCIIIETVHLTIVDTRSPFWPIFEKFSGRGKRMRAAEAVLDDFAYGVIDDRQRDIDAQGEKDDGAKMDLLSYYMAVRDEVGRPMSRKALRDAVLNLIIAGVSLSLQSL